MLNKLTKAQIADAIERLRDDHDYYGSFGKQFISNSDVGSLLSNPLEKLSVNFIYRIVAFELGAYQTPDMGYELGEIRTDDQSGITLGGTYDISQQVSLMFKYEYIENTVFLTKEFYKENVFSTGLKIKF